MFWCKSLQSFLVFFFQISFFTYVYSFVHEEENLQGEGVVLYLCVIDSEDRLHIVWMKFYTL